MSKANRKRWNEIQKELNALYSEYDSCKISGKEYSKKLSFLRDRQDRIRDK